MKRNCFICVHWRLCFLKKSILDSIYGVQFLSVDGKKAPGEVHDILSSLANCCTLFEELEEK